MLGKIKIKILVVAILVMLVALMAQSTLAYYSTVGRATNVVTSGNIRFIIHELTDSGEVFPEEGVYITPGDVVSKQVHIENDCEHPFYLRVKVVYGVDSQELSADCFRPDIDETNWELHDGWYYYKEVVEPGETTPDVFTQVEVIGSKMDNSYLGKELQIVVVAQAVQSENNPISDGNTYTASGWPVE